MKRLDLFRSTLGLAAIEKKEVLQKKKERKEKGRMLTVAYGDST